MSLLQYIRTSVFRIWRQRRREALRRPEVLRKWYQWKSASVASFHICYVPLLSDEALIPEITQGCEQTLQRVTELLGIGPLKRPITLFLYPDMHSFQRCEQIQGTAIHALTRHGKISLPFQPWPYIARTMAHELAHAITGQLIAANAVMLLNEGIATYVENKLYPFESLPPLPCMEFSLRDIANYYSFYKHLTDHQRSHDTYGHAHSFALYLIQRHGMDCFLRLIRCASHNNVEKWPVRFNLALRTIYGVDVQELERQWHEESAMAGDGSMLCWDWMLVSSQQAIRNAEQAAEQQMSKFVETEHLLWAILKDTQCLGSRLLLQVASQKDILQAVDKLSAGTSLTDQERPTWAPAARQCIALAIGEARTLRCTYIGTEHLLLGLMSQATNPECHVLNRCGVEQQTLRSVMIKHYRTSQSLGHQQQELRLGPQRQLHVHKCRQQYDHTDL